MTRNYNKEIEVEVTAVFTMSKTITVYTDDYETEIENTEDGKNVVIKTNNTNFKQAFEDEHYTIPELLEEFAKDLEERVKNYAKYDSKSALGREYKRCYNLLQGCKNWVVDEYEVVN